MGADIVDWVGLGSVVGGRMRKLIKRGEGGGKEENEKRGGNKGGKPSMS